MDKITLHYFFVRRVSFARGENVKLLLVDAGLDHEYIRPAKSDNWPETKKQLKAKGHHRGTMPYIEVGDQVFAGSVPILRYLSAKLGKYNGSNDEERYRVDVAVDAAEDWFHSFKNGLVGGEEGEKKHLETELPNWLSIFEGYYGETEGSYLLGENITYADMLVYHMIDDEGVAKNLNDYPNLQKFVSSFEARPNIAPYLASLAAQA
ncbi:glutathione S-transferase [Backusella circina FSU 941]|nr:glutathione S-transferase [Backusella circina FSU 941]